MRSFKNTLTLLILAAITAWLLWPDHLIINPTLPIGSVKAEALDRLSVPEGYRLNVYAENLPGIRMIEITPNGDLIASQPKSGKVLLLRRDQNNDGRADAVETLIDGLNRPHGLALDQNWLYVAETNRVIRVPFDSTHSRVELPVQVLIDQAFPGGGGHWSRSLGIGPDNHLYITVGSSCNVCEEADPTRATMLRYQIDGSTGDVYARGLRNSVGFDWHPITHDLYATDNGRDLLGDDFPPCELNLIDEGQHYGWPYANGMNEPDPEYGVSNPEKVVQSTPPVHEFRAHNAPLGIQFLHHPLNSDQQATALVALHGSWNRSQKDGYKVVALDFDADGQIREYEFLTGFEEADDVIGRPVDIAQNADGDIFVSDDYGGRVLRVSKITSIP